MRTTKDLAGLAVIDVRNGKKLGQVTETIVSPDDGKLLGFVMKQGGMLSREESVVEIEDVRSIGTDAVTVEGDEIVRRPEASRPEFQEARGGERTLIGRKVVSQGGTLLGTVADVVLNEEARRASALVIGGGVFDAGDAMSVDRVVSVGPDVVIVTDAARTDDDDRGPFET